MLKKLIFLDDVNLFNMCEVEAQRHQLTSAQDFIIYSLEKYLLKKYPEKIYKKPLELWVDCEKEAHEVYAMTVPEFIEAVVHLEISGVPIQEVKAANEEKKKSWRKRIADIMSLPVG